MKATRGSVLVVVLVVYVVMSSLLIGFSLVTSNYQLANRNRQTIDETRLLELSLLEYYKRTSENDILFSDELQIGDYQVIYTVDVMLTYHRIITTITNNNESYQFTVRLRIKDWQITSFKYT